MAKMDERGWWIVDSTCAASVTADTGGDISLADVQISAGVLTYFSLIHPTVECTTSREDLVTSAPCAHPWQDATEPAHMDRWPVIPRHQCLLKSISAPEAGTSLVMLSALTCTHLHHVLRLERVQPCSQTAQQHVMTTSTSLVLPVGHQGIRARTAQALPT